MIYLFNMIDIIMMIHILPNNRHNHSKLKITIILLFYLYNNVFVLSDFNFTLHITYSNICLIYGLTSNPFLTHIWQNLHIYQ